MTIPELIEATGLRTYQIADLCQVEWQTAHNWRIGKSEPSSGLAITLLCDKAGVDVAKIKRSERA